MCNDNVCGDGIRTMSQQCDNGNIAGCLNCTIDSTTSCGGDPTLTPCNCSNSNLVFNLDTLECNINCSSVQYSVGLKSGSVTECSCLPNYYFDIVASQCVIDCSTANSSTGLLLGSIDFCSCPLDYYFDSQLHSCILNCSRITYASGYTLPKDINSCLCIPSFYFDSQVKKCVIGCSQI